jgi:hypothetical protein
MTNVNIFLILWLKNHMSNMDLNRIFVMQIDASICQFYIKIDFK